MSTHFASAHFASNHFASNHFDAGVEQLIIESENKGPFVGKIKKEKHWEQLYREDEEMLMLIKAFMEIID